MSKDFVIIYTDGACSPNPGIGGWGAVLISNQHNLRTELSGSEVDSTNNRMEMTASIKALEALKKPCIVELYTDSSYVKMRLRKTGSETGRTTTGKVKGEKLLQIKTSGFNCLNSVTSTKFHGTGLKATPEMRKMTAATNLLFKPERILQSQFNPDTP